MMRRCCFCVVKMKKMEEYLSASLSLSLSVFLFLLLTALLFSFFLYYIQGREESAFEAFSRALLANGFVKAKKRTRLHLSTSLSLSLSFTKRPLSLSWLWLWLSSWWSYCSNGASVCFCCSSSFRYRSSREVLEARTIPSCDGLERRLVFEIRISFFLARRKTQNLSRGRSRFGTPTSLRCTDARRSE